MRGVAVGELVEAAVLEKSPHRPDVAASVASKTESVMSALPGKSVAQFDGCIPSMHGRRGESVAYAGVALSGEPGSAPRASSSETDSLNPELPDDVVHIVVLRSVIHRKAG